MRVSTQQAYIQSISNMQEKMVNLARYQEQISTGKRLLSPSDDPAVASRILEIGNSISATEQFQQNADTVTVRLQQEDAVLGSTTQTLQRVRELVIQAKNDSLTTADRSFIAAEVSARLDELIGLSNSRSSNGEYIFSGNKAKTQAFSQIAGGAVYNGDQGQRQLQISADRRIADSDNGHDVFVAIRNGNGTFSTGANNANTGTAGITSGSVLNPTIYQPDQFEIRFTSATTFDVFNVTTSTPVATSQAYTDGATISTIPGIEVVVHGAPATGDVFTVDPSANQSMFSTVSNTVSALTNNVGSAGDRALFQQNMDNALIDLDQSIERLLQIRTSVGARLKAVDSQIAVNDEFQFQMKSVRSQLEDTDLAEVISQLSLESTALQALQQSFVKTQSLSLFNFL